MAAQQTEQKTEKAGRGWFADVDREQTTEYRWQPCLETGKGHVPCFQVWFASEAECEEWIAENVIGVGWSQGEPSSLPPVKEKQQ